MLFPIIVCPAAIIDDDRDQDEEPTAIAVPAEEEEEIIGGGREEHKANQNDRDQMAPPLLADRIHDRQEEEDGKKGVAEDRCGPGIIMIIASADRAGISQRQIKVVAGRVEEGDQSHQFAARIIADRFKHQMEELLEIRNKTLNQVNLRKDREEGIRVVVGMATCGIAAGARPVLNAFTEEIAKRGLSNVTVTQTGCIGMCRLEPIVEVTVPGQDKVTYVHMSPEKAARVVAEHIVNNNPVVEYTVGAAE